MESVVVENSELLNKLRVMRQDLVKERAQVCQLASEKIEADQNLHVCIYIIITSDSLFWQKMKHFTCVTNFSEFVSFNILSIILIDLFQYCNFTIYDCAYFSFFIKIPATFQKINRYFQALITVVKPWLTYESIQITFK